MKVEISLQLLGRLNLALTATQVRPGWAGPVTSSFKMSPTQPLTTFLSIHRDNSVQYCGVTIQLWTPQTPPIEL